MFFFSNPGIFSTLIYMNVLGLDYKAVDSFLSVGAKKIITFNPNFPFRFSSLAKGTSLRTYIPTGYIKFRDKVQWVRKQSRKCKKKENIFSLAICKMSVYINLFLAFISWSSNFNADEFYSHAYRVSKKSCPFVFGKYTMINGKYFLNI